MVLKGSIESIQIDPHKFYILPGIFTFEKYIN